MKRGASWLEIKEEALAQEFVQYVRQYCETLDNDKQILYNFLKI